MGGRLHGAVVPLWASCAWVFWNAKSSFFDDACRPGDLGFDEWMRLSEGFRVMGPNGKVGIVKRHRYREDGSLEALIVRSGLFRSARVEVSPERVECIFPVGRRLLLQGDA
jgi:hypothetical protein